MPIPVALAGLMVAGAIGRIISTGASIYQTYVETENADKVNEYNLKYGVGYYDENTRFWNDYIQRHHLGRRNTRYPYRTGVEFDRSRIYSPEAFLKNNEVNRSLSWFRLLGGGGIGQGAGLYRGLYRGD